MNAAFYFGCAVAAGATASRPGATLLDFVAAIAALLGVVAVHELGHLGVARAAGYRARLRYVLPGYGRTTIWSPNGRGWGYIALVVAGPVAGAVFGAGLAIAFPSLRFLGWLAVAESLVNLLPFGILDGAKALATYRNLRAQRRTVFQRQFSAAAVQRSADELLLRGLPPLRRCPDPRRRRAAAMLPPRHGESATHRAGK